MPKGLVPCIRHLRYLRYQGGRPWLMWQIEAASLVGIRRIILVLGHEMEAHYAAIPALKNPSDNRSCFNNVNLAVAINPAPERGQFSSLQCGLQEWLKQKHQKNSSNLSLSQSQDAVFILPVDVPCPQSDVWLKLLLARSAQTMVCIPQHKGHGGHPVLISPKFAAHLLQIPIESDNARLDTQIRLLAADSVANVAVSDPKVVANINTPDDLKLDHHTLTGEGPFNII